MTGRTVLSPGRAACEAFRAAAGAGPDGQPPDAAWQWARTMNAVAAWEAAAQASAGQIARERDQLRQQLDASTAELNALSGVAAEMLAALDSWTRYDQSPADAARIAGWQRRAGLKDRQPDYAARRPARRLPVPSPSPRSSTTWWPAPWPTPRRFSGASATPARPTSAARPPRRSIRRRAGE